MIKFKGIGNGNKPLIGIGLSDGNMQKLRENKPIYIMREEMGIDYDLLIFWGKTEKEMEKKLQEIGMITDETDIKRGFIEQ